MKQPRTVVVLLVLVGLVLPWAAPLVAQGAEGQEKPAESSAEGEEAAPILRSWEWPEWTPQPVLQASDWIQANPLLGTLVLVVGFWLLAKLSEFVILRIVARLTSRTQTDVDDQLLRLVQRPIFITVFFIGLTLASRALQLPDAFSVAVIGILLTFVIFSWLGAALPGLRLVLDALGRHSERFPLIEERTIPLFDIVGKIVLIGGAGFAIFGVWGIDPAPWFASAGVVGIAVGFAARDTLANLFAGIFIIADSPYKLGDFITLDSGERGLVTHVGIRSTRLLTRDDIEITLPNSVIANAKILNESGGRWEKERIRLKVGVAYGVDVDRVSGILENVALEHDHICPDPAPRVRLRGFGDSSLDFELLCWIDEPVLRGKLTHEMYMDIYKVLGKEEIEIPFPQRDLWVRRIPQAEIPENNS
ncbi:MAG: mechanosensitive ion channel family protein [Thermoanaerobaculia bacterium]|nr:mechanosensitive ion channel family protein [Thermoanaerobaculia bacterium]